MIFFSIVFTVVKFMVTHFSMSFQSNSARHWVVLFQIGNSFPLVIGNCIDLYWISSRFGAPNICVLDLQDCPFVFLILFCFLWFSHLPNFVLFSISVVMPLISKNTFLFSKCSYLCMYVCIYVFTVSCPYFLDRMFFISAFLDLLRTVTICPSTFQLA